MMFHHLVSGPRRFELFYFPNLQGSERPTGPLRWKNYDHSQRRVLSTSDAMTYPRKTIFSYSLILNIFSDFKFMLA